MKSRTRLFNYIKKERKTFALVLLLMTIYLISQIMVPFIIGRIINSMVDKKEVDNVSVFVINVKFDVIISYSIISSILILLGTISSFFYEYNIAVAAQKIVYHFRLDIFKKMNNISISQLETKQLGVYVQYEINDMENINLGISTVFKQLTQGILQIIITIIFMFITNWFLAIIVIFLSPLSLLVSKFVASFSNKYFQKQRNNISKLTSYSVEYSNNINLIQSLNYDEDAQVNFDKYNNELKEVSIVSQFSASWTNPTTRLVNNIIYVIVGITSIIMAYYSYFGMAIGGVSTFLSYTSSYTKPFNDISSVIGEYESFKTSLGKINSFLNLDDDIDGNKPFNEEIKDIEFKNMTFAYPSGKVALDSLNLKIDSKEKIAIVGETGSGKTTLVSLLLRFYEPTKGSILINGKDIKDIKKEDLRKKIGMVLQDTWLFNGTIMENLGFSSDEIDENKIINLCKEIGADSFINTLEKKYDTNISSTSDLSAGQKQILTIGRALLNSNDLIILDEATSNIDTRSEIIIKKAIEKLTKGKTAIFIAHRLSTIVNSDRIIALKDGKIVEIGNHKELLLKKGYYYNLYQSQFK